MKVRSSLSALGLLVAMASASCSSNPAKSGGNGDGGDAGCVTTCSLPAVDANPPRSAVEGQCDPDAGTLPNPALCGIDYYASGCALPADCQLRSGGGGLNAGPIVCCSQPR